MYVCLCPNKLISELRVDTEGVSLPVEPWDLKSLADSVGRKRTNFDIWLTVRARTYIFT
jgi:hypothetical protein